jgi:hypothetical protein
MIAGFLAFKSDAKATGFILLVGVVCHGIGFGFATKSFSESALVLSNAPGSWTFWQNSFGPGLYMSAVVCLAYVIMIPISFTQYRERKVKNALKLKESSINMVTV